MYFELQLSASVFTRMVRNRLRSLAVGIDLTIPGQDGSPLVVDQVVIGDATILQREQAIDYTNNVPQVRDAATQTVWTFSPTNYYDYIVPYLQLKQEVKILFVRPADLETNGTAPTSPSLTVTLSPVFNIALTPNTANVGVGAPMTLSYTLSYVDFGIASLTMTDAQRSQIAQVIGGFGIAPSTVDFSALTKTLGRPVAAINAGIACDPSGTRVAFRADFDVYASPPAINEFFFEAGPADLLAGKDWAMLMDANVLIAASEQKIKTALAARANLKIRSDPKGRWDAPQTTLRVGAEITILAACPGFIDDIDMDVALDLGAFFHVQSDDHLITDYRLGSAKTNSGQVFGCALTGALLYPFAGAALFAGGKIGWTDYLGGIGFGPFFAFGQLVGVINAQGLEDNISKSLGDTCHKVNDEEYQCTTIVNQMIQLVPNLNSRLVLEKASGVPEGLVMSGSVSNLGELPVGDIGDIRIRPFTWQVIGGCTGNGKNNFRIGNRATISVDVTSPAKVVSARLLDAPQGGYAISINDNVLTITPTIPPVPYPCKVRLITTHGVRTLTFPPAQPLGDIEAQKLAADLLGAVLTCYYWEKRFTKVEEIRWLVDPAFHVVHGETVQFWQILVKGAAVGDKLNVKTPDGQTVMTAHPSSHGSFHASLMFAAHQAPAEISLELERPHDDAAKPLELAIQQTLYARRATLPMYDAVRHMEISSDLHQPQLLIMTVGQRQRWDVRMPTTPRLLEATARPAEPVADFVMHCGERMGAAASEIPSKALDRLVPEGEHQAVGRPRVLGFPETLYVRTHRGAAVYDISSPGEPREIHTLSSPGWFENTATSRNLMARYDHHRHVVEIYEVAGRHTLGTEQAKE